MKRIIVVSVLVLIFGVVATAAPHLRSRLDEDILELQRQIQIANVMNAVELSPEQLQEIYSLVKSTRGELEDLKDRITSTLENALEKAISGETVLLPEREAFAARMHSIMENYLTGLKSIISIKQGENLAEYFQQKVSSNRLDTSKMNEVIRERIAEKLPNVAEQLRQRMENLPPEAQERLKNSNVLERFEVMRNQVSKKVTARRPEIVQKSLQNRITPQGLAMILLSDEALEVMEKMLAK
ncbi:MAG TPA: hypothetical protein ENN47_00755 [Mesotoga infera]|uniref:Uncharacterized protein n=1 Tax=Mesotoga infera TaxID=1236046 RepID=A0A7C1GR85_9BACT|nr:hypothetical protein [Mesotoga infera]